MTSAGHKTLPRRTRLNPDKRRRNHLARGDGFLDRWRQPRTQVPERRSAEHAFSFAEKARLFIIAWFAMVVC
jgi:hypothetical protein